MGKNYRAKKILQRHYEPKWVGLPTLQTFPFQRPLRNMVNGRNTKAILLVRRKITRISIGPYRTQLSVWLAVLKLLVPKEAIFRLKKHAVFLSRLVSKRTISVKFGI